MACSSSSLCSVDYQLIVNIQFCVILCSSIIGPVYKLSLLTHTVADYLNILWAEGDQSSPDAIQFHQTPSGFSSRLKANYVL
jgi:hypothetical protein